MKTPQATNKELQNAVLLILKRGEIRNADRVELSGMFPDSKKIHFIVDTPDDDEIYKILKQDDDHPEPDTPHKLTHADKVLFLEILQNGITPKTADGLKPLGIFPSMFCFESLTPCKPQTH